MSDSATNPVELDRKGMWATESARNPPMLFTPNFDAFGCNVGRSFIARCGDGRVHALSTDPHEVREHIEGKLGDVRGQFWNLAKEEEAWSSTPASIEKLKGLKQELGPGMFGRIVVAHLCSE